MNNHEHNIREIDIIVSKGNKNGDITYANPIFFKLAGYTQGELLDKPHSIIKHPDMPKIIFKYLWERLENGKDVKTFIKNLSKDGGYYWVFAHIRVATNPDGSFRNYVSTRRQMSENARLVIEPLYKKLSAVEKEGGLKASLALLTEFLEENSQTIDTYDAYMQQLNKGK